MCHYASIYYMQVHIFDMVCTGSEIDYDIIMSIVVKSCVRYKYHFFSFLFITNLKCRVYVWGELLRVEGHVSACYVHNQHWTTTKVHENSKDMTVRWNVIVHSNNNNNKITWINWIAGIISLIRHHNPNSTS